MAEIDSAPVPIEEAVGFLREWAELPTVTVEEEYALRIVLARLGEVEATLAAQSVLLREAAERLKPFAIYYLKSTPRRPDDIILDNDRASLAWGDIVELYASYDDINALHPEKETRGS